jgi:spore coat protein U-like protein
MRSVSSVFVIGFLALCLALKLTLAATTTTSFSVSATVQVSCNVSSTARAFGTYNAVIENLRSFDSVHCSNSTPYNILFSAGQAANSTDLTKATRSTPPGYHFLSDAVPSLNWHQPLGAYKASVTGVGIDNSKTIGMRYAVPSSYVDTVIVTVIY